MERGRVLFITKSIFGLYPLGCPHATLFSRIPSPFGRRIEKKRREEHFYSKLVGRKREIEEQVEQITGTESSTQEKYYYGL